MPAQLKIPARLPRVIGAVISAVISAWLTIGVADVTRLDAQTAATEPQPSAEGYLASSYRYFQSGRFSDSIDAARAALKLRADYASAWNNIAAAYNAMGLFEDGLRAAEEAVRLQPDDGLAKNNLAWAKINLPSTAEGYLTQSFKYYREGKFEESIQAAQGALSLRPGYADAWNNIAAANNSMSRWIQGIQAAEEAIRLKPDNQLARNNLVWAQLQVAKQNSSHGR